MQAGAINMQSTDPLGIFGPSDAQGRKLTPFGTGPINYSVVNGVFGLPGNAFVDSYPNNPNVGLRVLGDRWHGIDGGVAFGCACPSV